MTNTVSKATSKEQHNCINRQKKHTLSYMYTDRHFNPSNLFKSVAE